MSANLIAVFAIAALVSGIGVYLIRIGRGKEREAQKDGTLKAIDAANEVRRDIARESDPIGRLRDKWSRPMPGKPADPD